jgi:hypothetical protein
MLKKILLIILALTLNIHAMAAVDKEKNIGLGFFSGSFGNSWHVGITSDIRLFKNLHGTFYAGRMKIVNTSADLNWVTGGLKIKGSLTGNDFRGYFGILGGAFFPGNQFIREKAIPSFSFLSGLEAEIILKNTGLLFVFLEVGLGTGEERNLADTSRITIGKASFYSGGLRFFF